MISQWGVEIAGDRSTVGTVVLPPPVNTITIGGNLRVANTRLGWTSVHAQRKDATTAALLGQCAAIANQHLLGFGATTDPQPGAGAAYDWSSGPASMDFYYGHPTKADGYFAQVDELCITFCGCPPHMRSPKAGSGSTWDPMGNRTLSTGDNAGELTSLSKYAPPHHDWFQEYADLCAAFMVRFPWVKFWQFWNETKRWFFGTQYPGSSLIVPGSGLPARSGSGRWWTEGFTALYNVMWTTIKAARPDSFGVGPYHVYAPSSWEDPASWADDAFSDRLMGPYGYADKEILASLRYFIENCVGCDALCVDIRNTANDWKATRYYSPTSMPGTPDPGNAWLQNPNGGTTPTFFLEGVADGPWNGGQIHLDFQQWLRDLGNFGAQWRRPVCDARTIPVVYAEWYARVGVAESTPNPATGNFYPGAYASHQEMAAMFAWIYMDDLNSGTYYSLAWKPEGSVGQEGNRDNDPGCAHPLALWNQFGSPNSLAPTALAPVCQGLVTHFPPGVQLKVVSSNVATLKAVATDNKIMVVNRSATPTNVTIEGTVYTLAGFEVRFIDRVTTSGFPMPLTDPAGFTTVFADNFTSYGDIPLGSFFNDPTAKSVAATGGRWGGYGNATSDAAGTFSDTTGRGQYNMTKTCSITNGVFDIWLRSEMVGGVQKNWCAAPWPIIPANQPVGTIKGYDYTANPNNNTTGKIIGANIFYGEIEFAFRFEVCQGWKVAWLLWPDRGSNTQDAFGNPGGSGEIDGPEASLSGDDTISGYMHWDGSNSQTVRNSLIVASDGQWHKWKTKWTDTLCEFYLDGVMIGASITAHMPNNPMHWIFQSEVVLFGAPDPTPPVLGSNGHLQIDWVVIRQKNGVYPFLP